MKELVTRFHNEFGTLMCSEIQREVVGASINFWNPDELEKFKSLDGHAKCGMQVVAKVAGWVVELLLKYQEENSKEVA